MYARKGRADVEDGQSILVADYRDSTAEFVQGKARKYRQRDGLDRGTALIQAVNKASGRYETDETGNSFDITAALLCLEAGDKHTKITVTISDTNGERISKLVLRHGSVTVTRVGAHVRYVSVRCPPIPMSSTMGRVAIKVLNKSFESGNTTSSTFGFSLGPAEELDSYRRPSGEVLLTSRVRLYLASEAPTLAKQGAACSELLLALSLGSEKGALPSLRGVRFVVTTKLDAHSAVLTPSLTPLMAPHVKKIVKITKTTKTMVKVSGGGSSRSIHQIIDELICGHAQRCSCSCPMNKCTCLSGSRSAMRVSWSVSHYENLVCCSRGNEQRFIGHLGEVLTSIEIVRRVLGEARDSVWCDDCLHQPGHLRALLKHHPAIIAALEELYEPYGRLPTVMELVTHTAGLPEIGCLDTECYPTLMEKILPCVSGAVIEDGASREECLLRMLQGRVVLEGPPGGRVCFSMLGYAILSLCGKDYAESIARVCRELKMNNTRVVLGRDVAERAPGDLVYAPSRLVQSTTNDLCNLAMRIEACSRDAEEHPNLSFCMQAMYRIKGNKGEKSVHSACVSGMQSSVIRVRTTDVTVIGSNGQKSSSSSSTRLPKISVTVFHKVGEHRTDGTSILVYCPAMHLGFSAFLSAECHALFGSRSHKECGYGKKKADKVFMFKHFLKLLLLRCAEVLHTESGTSVMEFDSAIELAWCRTPHRPPQSFEQKNELLLASESTPLPTQLATLFDKSPLFAGQSRDTFYPIGPSYELIAKDIGDKLGGDIDMKATLAGLPSISVTKEEGTLMLYDNKLRVGRQIVYDSKLSLRCGRACNEKNGLVNAGFRVASLSTCPDATETLMFCAIPTANGEDAICLRYRGSCFVSKTHLLRVKERTLREYSTANVNSSINRAEQQRAKLRPWATVNATMQKREESQLIAGRGGGAFLGGLATGAVLSGLAYPRPYYPYYPPPPYPYAYYGPAVVY